MARLALAQWNSPWARWLLPPQAVLYRLPLEGAGAERDWGSLLESSACIFSLSLWLLPPLRGPPPPSRGRLYLRLGDRLNELKNVGRRSPKSNCRGDAKRRDLRSAGCAFLDAFCFVKKTVVLIQTVGCVWQIGTEIFAFCIGGFKACVEDAWTFDLSWK